MLDAFKTNNLLILNNQPQIVRCNFGVKLLSNSKDHKFYLCFSNKDKSQSPEWRERKHSWSGCWSRSSSGVAGGSYCDSSILIQVRNKINELCCGKICFSGFQTRSNTNWTVQPQKMVRGLKFGIHEVEGLYYLCSENKGADQLCRLYSQLICIFVLAH